MSGVKIEKAIASLPATLEANAIYLVRAGAGFDLYAVDSTGTTAHQLNTGGSGTIILNGNGPSGTPAEFILDGNG